MKIITRTITKTKVTARFVNKNTAELEEFDVTLYESTKDMENLFRKLRYHCELYCNQYTPLKIISAEENNEVRGMAEDAFEKYSQPMATRTKFLDKEYFRKETEKK